jgi:hypothetical protein
MNETTVAPLSLAPVAVHDVTNVLAVLEKIADESHGAKALVEQSEIRRLNQKRAAHAPALSALARSLSSPMLKMS